MAKCRHCGKVIRSAYAGWQQYWYHPEGETVYCRLGDLDSKRAEPA